MVKSSGLYILLFLVACGVENQAFERQENSRNGAYRVYTTGNKYTKVEIHEAPVWLNKHDRAYSLNSVELYQSALLQRVYIYQKMSFLVILPLKLCGASLYQSILPHDLPCTSCFTQPEVEHRVFWSTEEINTIWHADNEILIRRTFQRKRIFLVRNNPIHLLVGMITISYHPIMTSIDIKLLGPQIEKKGLSVKIYLCTRWTRHPSGGHGGYSNALLISSDMKKDGSCSYFSLLLVSPCKDINVARAVIEEHKMIKSHGTKSFFATIPALTDNIRLSFYHDTNGMVSYGKKLNMPVYIYDLPSPHGIPIHYNDEHDINKLIQTIIIHKPMLCTEILGMHNIHIQLEYIVSFTEDRIRFTKYAKVSRNMPRISATLKHALRYNLQHKYITMSKRCKQSQLTNGVCTGVSHSNVLAIYEGPYPFIDISKLFSKRCYRFQSCKIQEMRSLVIVDLYARPWVVNMMIMVAEQHQFVSFGTKTKVISVEHRHVMISHHTDYLGYDPSTIIIEQL